MYGLHRELVEFVSSGGMLAHYRSPKMIIKATKQT